MYEVNLRLCVQGEKYTVDIGVDVIPTPGYSGAAVSLVVQNTTNGTVLVAGKFRQSMSCMLD